MTRSYEGPINLQILFSILHLSILQDFLFVSLPAVSPTPRPTTAPALSSPPPDALTPLLPVTDAPPPTLPLTNQPTSSSATTVPSLVEVTVAEMTTQPTTPEETKVPPVGGEKEARTSDGLSSGSLAAVVVFAALVLIGVLLAVVYVVYKRWVWYRCTCKNKNNK